MRRAALVPAACLAAALSVSACAGVPEPPEAAPVTAPYPAIGPAQAERVRAQVQQRLQQARVAADPDLVAAAATGPAAELQQLDVRVAGPQDAATADDPLPAGVVVAPQVEGWPRWFAVVTVPGAAGAAGGSAAEDPEQDQGEEPAEEPSEDPDEASAEGAAAQELPVMEVYASPEVRSPYRLWARLTMLPGAELPAFDAVEVGSESLGDGPLGRSGTQAGAEEGAEDGAEPSAAPEEPDDVRAALADLAERYASVMTEGAASPSAAQFQPDPFVTAVRARAEAERDAVAAVAGTTVEHEPYGGGEVLFAARAADGDVLAVTAVTTTTTMAVRGGAGELRPVPEVAAAAGIEQTTGTLTTRSVAALAFVVPAEQGAIRLVAVGEGLTSAEATR